MRVIAASLGILHLLYVRVQTDDSDDETNINICLNINIGPGCAGGHCRPPPYNNCNRNTSSRPALEPGKLEPNPTRPKRTTTSSPTEVVTTAKQIRPENLDWHNERMRVCYDESCKAYSELLHYTKWVCLDDNICHCYGHQPVMNDKHGPGWLDEFWSHCDKQDCSNHCRNKAFGDSVCVEQKCHCYTRKLEIMEAAKLPKEAQQTQEPKNSLVTVEIDEGPGWENVPMDKCHDCIPTCKTKLYIHGICVDEKSCHCYSHTMNGIYGPGWEDDSLADCEDANCPPHCSFIGFVHGVCVDNDTCHCYDRTDTGAPQPGALEQRPWDDYPVENCSKCDQFCDLMGHTEGYCIEDPMTCHCYSCNPKVPKSGCADQHLPDCNRGSCSKACKESKFMQAFCMDQNTCHCYDFHMNEVRVFNVSRRKLDDLNVKVGLCYKTSCSYSCRMKAFSDGSCTNSSNCLCTWNAGGQDTLVRLCNRYSCSFFCTMMDYSYGTCTRMDNCHCSGGQSENKVIRRRNLMTLNQRICFDVICEALCGRLGSSEGVCSDRKTCKCGNASPKRTVITRRKKPSLSYKRDPLLDMTKDFDVEVCVLALCKQKCKQHNFRKGYCVERGSKPKCHCYVAKN